MINKCQTCLTQYIKVELCVLFANVYLKCQAIVKIVDYLNLIVIHGVTSIHAKYLRHDKPETETNSKYRRNNYRKLHFFEIRECQIANNFRFHFYLT